MQNCRICGGNDFYKEAGYFFCQTCQTQNEDIREEVYDARVDLTTRLRKTKIRRIASDRTGEELGWTSWELYNFILIGLTNELIELGVTTDIKLTILQLWATYLQKIEVAFVSKTMVSLPKLARKFNRRDAAIIYGKVRAYKRSRKRKRGSTSGTSTSMLSSFTGEGSSTRDLNRSKRLMINAEYDRFIQSQASSEGDGLSSFNQSTYSFQSGSVKSSNTSASKIRYSSHAVEENKQIKKLSNALPKCKRTKYRQSHSRSQFKTGPSVISPSKLWAIIYLALRIHKEPIHLADMLRYAREGHLSYYKLDHLLPPEISIKKKDINFLSQNVEITHKGMRRIIANMAKFLGVWNIGPPNFSSLLNRYCQELGLPRGILLYAERMVALSPPKMTFNSKKSSFPNYEARAMAYIIVVLKTLLGLDGITEYEISRVAEKINSKATNSRLLSTKLFSFREWQRYIECRKTILVHSHFPTKLKYRPNTHGIDDLYLKFLEFIHSKGEREDPETAEMQTVIPKELVTAMTRFVSDMDDVTTVENEIEVFPPSLTPLYSYLQKLLTQSDSDLPFIVQSDFFFAKVGFLTKPKCLQELAAACGIELDIVDSNLHFLEKIVPAFEQPRLPDIEKLKEDVEVQDDPSIEKSPKDISNVNDYIHRKFSCKMLFHSGKQRHYDMISCKSKSTDTYSIGNDFSFDDILPNGKLAIPGEALDSEDEDTVNTSKTKEKSTVLNEEIFKKYNLCLSDIEKESIFDPMAKKSIFKRKHNIKMMRNRKGQFSRRDFSANNSNESTSEEDSILQTEEPELGNNTQLDFVQWISNELESSQNKSLLLDNGDSKIDIPHYSGIFNLSQVSILEETLPKAKQENLETEKDTFFRPFKNYWMYHCIFSRVKPKNFEVFEKTLPRSFRWLLNECAHIIEMTTEDLYEEVCLVETYYSQILKFPESKSEAKNKSIGLDSGSRNLILSRW